MSKSVLAALMLMIVTVSQASFARNAYFSQRCKFVLDGVERTTEQSDDGDMFRLEQVRAQYIDKDAAPSTADDLAKITVTVLREQNGPSTSEDDGGDTTESYDHTERIVVRSVSKNARLGFALPVGTELDLTCKIVETLRN